MIATDRPSGATGATEEAWSNIESVSAHTDEFTGATNFVWFFHMLTTADPPLTWCIYTICKKSEFRGCFQWQVMHHSCSHVPVCTRKRPWGTPQKVQEISGLSCCESARGLPVDSSLLCTLSSSLQMPDFCLRDLPTFYGVLMLKLEWHEEIN